MYNYNYRLYCEDESCYVTAAGTTEPTECPNNAAHTIRAGSITQLDKKIPDVTPRQIRQALILSGVLMSEIETALSSLAEPTRSLAMTEWEYSNMFERDRPLVASVGAMLGWTDAQLDDLWILAGTL